MFLRLSLTAHLGRTGPRRSARSGRRADLSEPADHAGRSRSRPAARPSIVGRTVADKMSEIARPADRRRQPRRRRRHRSAPARWRRARPTATRCCSATPARSRSARRSIPNAGYDPRKDFAPIGMIGHAPNSLVVHPSTPAKSVQELVALRQGESRQGELRLGRRRHRQPRVGRIFRQCRRREARAHSLQGHRPGARRSDRRPHPDGVRADPGHARSGVAGPAARRSR